MAKQRERKIVGKTHSKLGVNFHMQTKNVLENDVRESRMNVP